MSDDAHNIPTGGSKTFPIDLQPGKTANYYTGNATIRFEVTYADGSAIETILGPNSEFRLTLGFEMVPEITMTILPESRDGPREID